MYRAILSFFRYIPHTETPISIAKPKSKQDLYAEILQSQLDELNRKVDEHDRKVKIQQQANKAKRIQ